MMLLLSLLLANAEPSKTAEKLGPVEVGAPFPIFGGNTAAGGYFSFKKNLGQQEVMVVSYFATWCKPCKKNLPIMEKFIQKNPNVNGVYIALEKESGKVKKFAEQYQLQTPIVMDKFEVMAKKHGVVAPDGTASLPKTFLVDKAGNVMEIYVHEGDDFSTRLDANLK